MQLARAIILHDSMRVICVGDIQYADTICGEFGVTETFEINGENLSQILDAVGIITKKFKKEFCCKGESKTEYLSLKDWDYPIINRQYSETRCLNLEAEENGNGLLKIRVSHPCNNTDGSPGEPWIENISHFGRYSVVWETNPTVAKK